LAFSPDGRQLAARLDDNTVRIRDVASGKDVHTLKGHKGFIFPIAFSADGKTLISAERDGPTLTWNAASGKQTGEIKHSFPHGNNINLSADGSLLAVSKDTYGFPAQQEIGIWETATGKLRTTIRNDSKEPAGLFVFSPDRKHIVGGMSAGLICVWEVNTGKETLRFTAHDFWANCLAISPDGKIVASTGGFEKTIRLWDFKTGKQLAQFPAHGYQVYSLAFSPDGSLLASGGADSTIMLWEVPKK
jgi:WD40 repeat protein